jgi:PAS domain S-box-containing protein
VQEDGTFPVKISGFDVMKDDNKTKKQLVDELTELRSQNAALEKSKIESKAAELTDQEASRYAESIVETVRGPLLVLDAKLKIISANRNFYITFKVNPGETIGSLIYDLGNKEWDIPKLRDLLENILPKKEELNDLEVAHVFQDIGYKIMLLNARQIYRKDIDSKIILLAIEDITDRKHAEKQLRKRSVELEAANKELDAFSHSVSHDLRAPLRGIDGWSLALLEDYGGQLDEQGRTYLSRVRAETQRMGALIEDLLQLSRMSRTEMCRQLVDMSGIARTLAARLLESAPERAVEFIIQPGLIAQGDAHLLEIALSNLLGNAFKFTGKCTQARIEFGRTGGSGGDAFFVRDNGAGFDMAYAKKLFGAFQRMHKTSDFPGTGIGLATVQRIVHRHGGRVWAEAAVELGATFYFTLE